MEFETPHITAAHRARHGWATGRIACGVPLDGSARFAPTPGIPVDSRWVTPGVTGCDHPLTEGEPAQPMHFATERPRSGRRAEMAELARVSRIEAPRGASVPRSVDMHDAGQLRPAEPSRNANGHFWRSCEEFPDVGPIGAFPRVELGPGGQGRNRCDLEAYPGGDHPPPVLGGNHPPAVGCRASNRSATPSPT
jgi:hypothetical protein